MTKQHGFIVIQAEFDTIHSPEYRLSVDDLKGAVDDPYLLQFFVILTHAVPVLLAHRCFHNSISMVFKPFTVSGKIGRVFNDLTMIANLNISAADSLMIGT